MSKRIDKRKLKRQTETAATLNTNATLAASAPEAQESAHAASVSEASVVTEVHPVSEQIDFFIQYQNLEYLEKDIIEKVKEKCKVKGTEVTAAEKLSVYLKPEDGKAYFTYAGYSSFVEV